MSLIDNEMNTAPIEAPVEPAAPAVAAKTGTAEQGNVGVTADEWSAGEQVATLAEQSDTVIMKHMSEYMASPTQNLTINDTAIENAQDMADEMVMLLTMSEDDLLTANFISPVAQMMQAKARAEADRRQDEERQENFEREEKRREAWQQKWDEDMHDYGGEQLTGAQIMERINWFSKKDNQEKVRQELVKQGKSKQEADDIITKMQERDELVKKQREGKDNPPLTPQELSRLNVLNMDKGVVEGTSVGATLMKEDLVLKQSQDAKIEKMNEASYLEQQQAKRELTADEKGKLEKLGGDKTVQAMRAILDEPKSIATAKESLNNSNEAYQHFVTAPHMKDEFVLAASADAKERIDLAPSNDSLKSSQKITAAKIDNVAASFM